MQDLIERLRERSNYNLAHCDCDKCLDGPCVRCLDAAVQSEAAEAITTAQAEIEALREEVERNDAIIRSLQNELQAHKDALAQWESGWRNWREADD